MSTITADAITEPGVYDFAEARYFADPALSFSGAKRLLAPSCPAIFRHEQLHGRAPKATFDFGHAAHLAVLGVGAPLAVIDADDWRTKAAREQRAQAYADGHIPVLRAEYEQTQAMAAALRANPVAAALLDPASGKAEQSLFWRDPTTDLMRRARLDWLPEARRGRLIVPDYKTCVSAEPAAFAKSVANYSYYMQARHYLDGVEALGLGEDPAFVFIAQEKTAPYLVTVFELDAYALQMGRQKLDEALAVYAECMASDIWPSYTDDVEVISLPPWFA